LSERRRGAGGRASVSDDELGGSVGWGGGVVVEGPDDCAKQRACQKEGWITKLGKHM